MSSSEELEKFIKVTKEVIIAYYTHYKIHLIEDLHPAEIKNPSVSAEIFIHSQYFSGTFRLFFQYSNYIDLFTKVFFKKNHLSLDDDLAEGAKEILNILSGTIHRKINNFGDFDMSYSTPSYSFGHSLAIPSEKNKLFCFKDANNSSVYIQFDMSLL